MKKVKIFCAGCVVADEIFRLPRLPAGDGKFFAAARTRTLGGMAAAAAAAIAALGGRAALWAPAGKDADGKFLQMELERAGVEAKLLTRRVGTAFSAVCVDDGGKRMVINHAPPGLYAPPKAAPPLRGYRAVLADVRWAGGALAALRAAQAAGIPAVLDWDATALSGAAAWRLMRQATHIVFSRQGLRGLSAAPFRPAAALREVQQKTNAQTAMTDGKNGVVFLRGGKAARIAAPVVRVNNTLGAGDVFHGALAFYLAKNKNADFADGLRFAAAAAAVKCSKAAGNYPRLREVERLLKK